LKIIISDLRLPKGEEPIRKVFAGQKPEIVLLKDPTPEVLREAIAQADAIVCGTTRIGAEVIEAGKNLKIIQKAGLRYENIDVAAAKKQNIPVCVARRLSRIQIAEHAFALLLALQRNILQAHRDVVGCEYEKKGMTPIEADQNRFVPNWFGYQGLKTLYGKTVGILGMGEIGSEVALHAHGFGMKSLYHQRHRIEPKAEEGLSAIYVSLEELLRKSDALVICVPQTPETLGMIGARELSLMKPSSFMINVAKGAVVDEAALAEALEQRRIAGAGLDVFSREPLPKESPLLSSLHTVLTPHLAMGETAGGNLEEEVVQIFVKVKRVLEGHPAENGVS